MKLPEVFPGIKLTQADRRRLEPHLSGYNKLVAVLTLGTVPQDDVKKMILIELDGQKRKQILDRLVGRLMTCIREAVKAEVDERIRA